MKRILHSLFILTFFHLFCNAQAYRHIGVENGLSSRKIYSIQKDKTGYIWFLTHEGIDRYDGKEFKHYSLEFEGSEMNSLQDLNWLYADSEGVLWEIGKRGRVFRYNPINDRFQLVYIYPEVDYQKTPTPISYSFIDNNDVIWLCSERVVYLFNPDSLQATRFDIDIPGNITYVTESGENNYCIGTDLGIHHARFQNDSLVIIPNKKLEEASLQVNNLYYDKSSRQLFIGTVQKGLSIFNIETQNYLINPGSIFSDITITRIKPLNENEILIATDGAGIYKLNTYTYETTPYVVADYNQDNTLTGNNIMDVYIDNQGRIWMANYPIGITIRDNRYSQYVWYNHTTGSEHSLINDRVNHIIEDSDGDLWFATNNGISLYNTHTKEWNSFLSTFNPQNNEKNYVFLSLCEAEKGVIYAGGYSSGLYKIDKEDLTTDTVSYEQYSTLPYKPDKYIRSIIKDTKGNIWIGGFYNLKRIDAETGDISVCPNLEDITAIHEKDDNNLWIGCSTGLYLLNKSTYNFKRVDIPMSSTYIYSLCQTNNGKLYIGTNGSGLIAYNMSDNTFEHFNRGNSALISNNIYTILCDEKGNIIFSSESGLTRFTPATNDFQNWTKEQGLKSNFFSPSSGTVRSNGNFVFGSAEGAVEFSEDIQLPRSYLSNMIFSEFNLFYEPVYPGEPDSPLTTDINQTKVLKLNHDQNIFSLKVSSINYDYPSDILYSWRLEGFYDTWSRPSSENVIRFTNLSPGNYTLQIRAISNENRAVLQERSIGIIIEPPFWKSLWAVLFYLIAVIVITNIIFRMVYLRKRRKISEEKFQFFINTAHDIRTPLTLVKAPLEEIKNTEQLTPEGTRNMNTALRNVNVLLRLTNNLINFEHTDIYSSELYIAEFEVNTFMNEIVKSFLSYSKIKKIDFTYQSEFSHLNAWFDKEKMDSIIRNIISNALKYTPENGKVTVSTYESAGHWTVEIKDTGIGIPASEQKKIFKDHFRGSNAINSKVTGSGMGMVLVGRMVKLQKGKIVLKSSENEGTSIKVSFPKGYNHYKKAHLALSPKDKTPVEEYEAPAISNAPQVKQAPRGKKILLVEDNDELRAYLQQTLSVDYNVKACENGKEALDIVKDYMPELIISDIMMPEMSGNELCAILKKDIETSHIPIILLTALNDEKSILKGIQTGADEYIVKPFNISILKATVANLLTNRSILRNKYADLDLAEENDAIGASINCATNLDWKFVSTLRGYVEENMNNPEFKVDALCSLMNMSRTSLYNKIKVLTDMAPSDFVRLIRLKKAAELLQSGQHTVTEVAEMTGFNDAKYFREVFKKHFNVSPSKYKG